MNITVSQDNIDHGLRGSCTSDPVALALQDAGFNGVRVGFREIRASSFKMLRQYYVFPIPDSVIDFAHKFDNGKPCKPFTFKVDL